EFGGRGRSEQRNQRTARGSDEMPGPAVVGDGRGKAPRHRDGDERRGGGVSGRGFGLQRKARRGHRRSNLLPPGRLLGSQEEDGNTAGLGLLSRQGKEALERPAFVRPAG